MDLKLVMQLFPKAVFEFGSIYFVHKVHSQKRCCSVSLYNSQKEHLDQEIIMK